MGYNSLKKILASLPPGPRPPPPIFIGVAEPLNITKALANFAPARCQNQDYFCSVGKSDRRRDVTQGNSFRPSEWFLDILRTFTAIFEHLGSCFLLDTNFPMKQFLQMCCVYLRR